MSEAETRQRGYPQAAHRHALVDFDGTLYPFGGLLEELAPLPGAVDAMQRLAAAGYRITIFTARLDPVWLASEGHREVDMRAYIDRMLQRDAIPYDAVIGKPAAEVYIDDRAVRYQHDWDAIVDWVLFAREP